MPTSRMDTWIQETENLPSLTKESIKALQLRKLCGVLMRERERHGFYRDFPERIESLEELKFLPFTTQEDLLRNCNSMLIASKSMAARVIADTTTGTSGHIKKVYYSDRDLESTIGFFQAGLGELVYPDDRVLIALPRSGPNGLSSLISAALERLGAVPIVAGVDVSYSQLIAFTEKEKPSSFIGMPVPLLSLLRLCKKCSITRAVVSADTIPHSVEMVLGRDHSVELFPHYGSREMGLGGAFTCKFHNGMHLRENQVIAEIVDTDGSPMPPGEYGELVITTVGMELLPLIRYRTGDRARIIPGDCECMSVTTRIDGTRRIRQGIDISTLDDYMFELETLIDYEVTVKDKDVLVSAVTIDGQGETAIRNILHNLLDDRSIIVSVLQASPEKKPKYVGKRVVRTA